MSLFLCSIVLGSGAFGRVYQVEYKGKTYAVKVSQKRGQRDNEVKLLAPASPIAPDGLVPLIACGTVTCKSTGKTLFCVRGTLLFSQISHIRSADVLCERKFCTDTDE